MKTHRDILFSIGVPIVAKYLKTEKNTVYQWAVRKRIPARHWVKVAYLANKHDIKVTVRTLEKMYDDSKKCG